MASEEMCDHSMLTGIRTCEKILLSSQSFKKNLSKALEPKEGRTIKIIIISKFRIILRIHVALYFLYYDLETFI